MQRWEYLVKKYTDKQYLQSTLNRLGDEGWELIQMNYLLDQEGFECILKRPIL